MYRKFFVLISMFLVGCTIPFLDKAEKETMCSINSINDVKNLFPTTVEEIDKRTEQLKKDVVEQVQKIVEIPDGHRTFSNTVKALDNLSLIVSRVLGPLSILKYVSSQKDLREAAYQKILELTPFMQDEVSKNKALFEAFKAYVDGNLKKEPLTDEQRYFVDEAMFSYKKEGMLLPAHEMEHVKKLNNELSVIGQEFSKNINEDATKLIMTAEDLVGVSEIVVDSLEKDEKGNYFVGVDYPTFFSVMKHAKKEETRKKMSRAFQNKAYPKNIALLQKLIVKRDELARALGFNTYAAYDIDHKMAKVPGRVEKFLEDLFAKVQGKVCKEFDMFTRELPEGVTLTGDGKIKPWDVAYIIEQYRQKHFDLNDAKIAEYFPVDHVVREVLAIYQQFLGLHFKEVSCDLWDSSVKSLEVYDNDNILRGYLLLDLYPRANKYPHACMAGVLPTYREGNSEQANHVQVGAVCPAVITVIANFPRGSKDKPGLLSYNDVSTFFHEFGHAMHDILGATELIGFSGTSVKWDFVEVPSQMFEEWLKDKDIMKKLSYHYQTRKSLPDETIQKIIDADKIDAGFFNARQIGLSLASLKFYQGPNIDLEKQFKDIMVRTRPDIMFDDEAHLIANWGHLTGYGSLYYSYLWSKVYSMDLFDTIERRGLLNPEVGQELRKKILGLGGSVDPNVMLRDFLGREPNQEAFLRRIGLS